MGRASGLPCRQFVILWWACHRAGFRYIQQITQITSWPYTGGARNGLATELGLDTITITITTWPLKGGARAEPT